jgi:hypothetical protein
MVGGQKIPIIINVCDGQRCRGTTACGLVRREATELVSPAAPGAVLWFPIAGLESAGRLSPALATFLLKAKHSDKHTLLLLVDVTNLVGERT